MRSQNVCWADWVLSGVDEGSFLLDTKTLSAASHLCPQERRLVSATFEGHLADRPDQQLRGCLFPEVFMTKRFK